MFGIGYQEMFIIVVVALVIFGPSRLPELAGQVGRWVRDFRRMSSDLTGEFEKTFAEVDEVKKSFKREMQSIQDEVEGIGKSARGDLKKSSSKALAAGKKTPSSALKTGGTGAAGRTAVAKAGAAKAEPAANGARGKKSTLETRKRTGSGLALDSLPVATKADPLADVSFFDLDIEAIASSNGAHANGAAVDSDAALDRVRRRRASAAYGRQPSA